MAVKTTISLDETLFERAKTVAKELNISRSRLFALALGEFLERYESQQLLDAFNAVYSDPPDAEEQAVMRAMRSHRAQMTKDQW